MLDTAGAGVSLRLMRMQKKGTSRGEKITVKGPKCNKFYQETMGVIDSVSHTHMHTYTHTHTHTHTQIRSIQ